MQFANDMRKAVYSLPRVIARHPQYSGVIARNSSDEAIPVWLLGIEIATLPATPEPALSEILRSLCSLRMTRSEGARSFGSLQ